MEHIRRIAQLSFERGESWTDCKTVVKLWVDAAQGGSRLQTHYFTMSLDLAAALGRGLLEAAQNGAACEKASSE